MNWSPTESRSLNKNLAKSKKQRCHIDILSKTVGITDNRKHHAHNTKKRRTSSMRVISPCISSYLLATPGDSWRLLALPRNCINVKAVEKLIICYVSISISSHLLASPRISSHLLTSPRFSSLLLASPHLSLLVPGGSVAVGCSDKV